MAFGDIFLHLLTGHLTLLSDEFGSEEFCSVVFDGFLLTSFSRWVLEYNCRPTVSVAEDITISIGLERFVSLSESFSSKENVHRHTLRMLLHLQHKVLPSYMETLMKTLEPPKQVGLISPPPLQLVPQNGQQW